MLEKLLKDQTDCTLIQLFRYTFTGTIAIIVDFYLLFVLTEIFKVHYLTSAALAYLTGLVVNYFLSGMWVFNKRTHDNFLVEFGLFALVGLIGLCLVEVLMWLFTEMVYLYYLISKIIATVLVSLWNFFARKSLLYS